MTMNEYEKKAIERLRPYLGECAVLLKSDGSFPLKQAGKISAYGRGVRHTLKGGTGSGEVNSRYYVTIEKGLEDAGFVLVSKDWLNAYDDVLIKAREDFIREIKAQAKANHTLAVMEGMGAVMRESEHSLEIRDIADTAIYVVSRICGEGNDRSFDKGDFRLNDAEIRDILKLNREAKRFLLVLNVGGPIDLSEVKEVKNILLLSQLGVDTGTALADILLGKSNPSGKLTTTWAGMKDYCNVGTFGDRNDSDYKEGIYVGYRYFDSAAIEPLFPFGFGLSYTEFEIDHLKTEIEKDIVKVKTLVRNTGAYAGKEAVQLYVSLPDGKLDKAYQELTAFRKTGNILPEEKEETELCFSLKSLASYDMERQAYVLEKGDYILRLGNSSRNTRVVNVLTLKEDIIVRQAKNCFAGCGFTDHVFKRTLKDDLTYVEHMFIDPKSFISETIEYRDDYPINEKVEKLSDEQLAYLNTGAFNEKGGIASVIGSASTTVAGAAGESSSKSGLKPLVMADGPAGLRISPLYYEDKKGIHSYGPSVPSTIVEFLPKIVQFFLNGNPRVRKGIILKEQYTTAIPIGTAIAQSFNEELSEICGDIVGKEMEIFNIDLWLAPALNIHRHVLCGRNFEYFSEDPLLSGKFAGAITRAVQKHPGKAVTIKHYAVNNQETNRYNTSSNVSERALREIYLRGFEICIREGHPQALMTSYNLLNGIHTNEHYGLCTDVLRSEFGFDGLIMTDWEISAMPKGKVKYRDPDADKCALAGNNLYMPGSKADYRKTLNALKNGKLDRIVLKRSASRLYDMTGKLKG